MTYNLISASEIKSHAQHALIWHWDLLTAGRRIPPQDEFNVPPDLLDPRFLNLWDVEREGRRIKFRAAYQGEAIAEIFRASWLGKTMDEVVPISLRGFALDAAKECVADRCAIYMVLSTVELSGRRVNCKRLLLPFGSDSKVEQILTSIQLTQVPRRVDLRKIVSHFEIDAKLMLVGRIESGFTNSRPGVAALTKAGKNARRSTRRKVKKAGSVRFGKHRKTCTIANLSSSGALVAGAGLSDAPDLFFLRVEMESTERHCRVVWRKDAQLGVRFVAIE